MDYSKKLWLWLGGIFLLSFAVLGLIGREIYVKAPPVPDRVVSASGETLYTKADIRWAIIMPRCSAAIRR